MNSTERSGIRVEGQKMEVLGRLTSAVIHDLNNLLTVIGLNAALIESGDLDPAEIVSAAEKISEASRHSADLTRKVLNFARKNREEPEPMQPDEVVEGMLRMLSPLTARRVSVAFTPGCGAWIHGDRSAVELAVMNLVMNAVDAMPTGGEIEISTAIRESFALIAVADRGEGVDPAVGARIFEPFFTTKEQGTGMGLAIVHHVAKHHGGSVEFDNRRDGGAEFRLLIPLSRPPESEAAMNRAGSKNLQSRRRGTVLLVEDDDAIRALTRKLLDRHFERVLDAPTAEEALKIWKREGGTIDLLLTDLMLPGDMSGRDLAVCISRDDPRLPVLYMSGYGSSWDDRSFVTETNFLPKPFPPDTLKQAITVLLDARS